MRKGVPVSPGVAVAPPPRPPPGLAPPGPPPSQPPPGPAAAGPAIPAATETLPARALTSPRIHRAGIATGVGAPTGHAATLARSLGIPAVTGLRGILKEVQTGDLLAVDGREGH